MAFQLRTSAPAYVIVCSAAMPFRPTDACQPIGVAAGYTGNIVSTGRIDSIGGVNRES